MFDIDRAKWRLPRGISGTSLRLSKTQHIILRLVQISFIHNMIHTMTRIVCGVHSAPRRWSAYAYADDGLTSVPSKRL